MITHLPPYSFARELLHELKIKTIPTPVEEICNKLHIEVIYTDQIEADAIIAKQNGETKIAIKITNPYEARTKFSIAHELGHFIIPTHMNDVYSCTIADFYNYSPDKLAEKEANEFAAELLLPTRFFAQDLKRLDLSVKNISMLADRYQTSLLATAVKFIDNCVDRGAIVYAQNGRICWTKSSKSFRDVIRTTGKINECSFASDFFLEGKTLFGKSEAVYGLAWSDRLPKSSFLVEETISMNRLGCTLSVIKPHDLNEDTELNEDDF